VSWFAPPEKVRDTLYREDHSAARTRSGPRAMATLRNLAAGALHLAVRHDTTEATRWASRNMDRPFHHSRTHFMILKQPWPLRRWQPSHAISSQPCCWSAMVSSLT
jgi:hypothetical protein